MKCGIETKRGEGKRKRVLGIPALAMLAVVALSGCSTVPDAINPAEWYRSATGEEKVEATPPPGADSSFPSAGRVDQQIAARDNRSGGLSADVEGRKYAESIPRQNEDSKNSLYGTPPAAPSVEAPAAPPAMPAAPVASAPPPAPVAAAPVPTPMPQPAATQAPMPTPMPAPATQTATADAPNFGTEGMRDRLAQQLAEIRARAADQGSLLPQDLAYGSESEPTIVVSSAGIEQQQTSSLSVYGDGVPPAAGNDFTGADRIDNDGALPLPAGTTKVATILFNNGSASLDINDRKILADVVRLQRQSGSKVRVIGHASQRTQNMDIAAHKMANLKVSEKRAQQIATELRKMGIAQGDILVAAVGDNQPVYLEIMPSGEAGNRRAEIYLSN